MILIATVCSHAMNKGGIIPPTPGVDTIVRLIFTYLLCRQFSYKYELEKEKQDIEFRKEINGLWEIKLDGIEYVIFTPICKHFYSCQPVIDILEKYGKNSLFNLGVFMFSVWIQINNRWGMGSLLRSPGLYICKEAKKD